MFFFSIFVLINFIDFGVNSECSKINVSSDLDPSLNGILSYDDGDYKNNDISGINWSLSYLNINEFVDDEEEFRYAYLTDINWSCFSIEFIKRSNFTITELGKSIPWDYCKCLNTCVVNMTFNMVSREFGIEDDAISISCLEESNGVNKNKNIIIAITTSVVIIVFFVIGCFILIKIKKFGN